MKLSKNYSLLLSSQFLSAFGDNVVLAIIIGQLTVKYRNGELNDSQLGIANAVYTCLFFIPYLAGASLAGYLNDRFSKTRWLTGGNIIKLLGTVLCALSVWFGEDWQKIGYFLIGAGACVYGPAKYGILPEILPKEHLVKANGTIELLTILAILSGPITGAKLVDTVSVLKCFSVVGVIYGISFLLNLLMNATASNPNVRLKASTHEFFQHFRDLFRSPRLSRILLGTGIFWICGAVLKMNFQPWGLHTLKLQNNTEIAKLGLWLGIGIIIGSVLAGQLHKIGNLKSTQLYGWLLSAAIVTLGMILQPPIVITALICVGAIAGLFLIPLNAALQAESDPAKLGKTIATQNFIDNAAMILGGIYVFGAIKLGLDSPSIFIVLGGIIAIAITCLKIPKQPNADGIY